MNYFTNFIVVLINILFYHFIHLSKLLAIVIVIFVFNYELFRQFNSTLDYSSNLIQFNSYYLVIRLKSLTII